MEKILEFNKGKFWDEHSKTYRFQCDCLSAEDAMDIDVTSYGENDNEKSIMIRMDFIDHTFSERLKRAWNVLRGKWGWREFCVREEDFYSLHKIFNPEEKYQDLL